MMNDGMRPGTPNSSVHGVADGKRVIGIIGCSSKMWDHRDHWKTAKDRSSGLLWTCGSTSAA
jgi:hypothetical protein